MNRTLPPLNDEQRALVLATARSMLGVPFMHQGRSKFGIDCIGFVAASFASIGFSFDIPSNYDRLPVSQLIESGINTYIGPPLAVRPAVKTFELQPLDIVTLTWSREASHVAIVTPHTERGVGIIHCYNVAKRVVEHGLDDVWRSRLTGVWRP